MCVPESSTNKTASAYIIINFFAILAEQVSSMAFSIFIFIQRVVSLLIEWRDKKKIQHQQQEIEKKMKINY
jgi:glycerol-3-phosphate acyltransferase PlsY